MPVSAAFAHHTLKLLSQATDGDFLWSNICLYIEGLFAVRAFPSSKDVNIGNDNLIGIVSGELNIQVWKKGVSGNLSFILLFYH